MALRNAAQTQDPSDITALNSAPAGSSLSKSRLRLIAPVVLFAVMPLMTTGCAVALLGGGAAGGATVAQDSRSFSTMIDDDGIEQKSYEILKSNSLLSQPEDTSISITSFNGNVLITGQTVNRDYIKWVVKQIEGLENVRKVYNYATLQKPVPASVVSSDALITSKVKAQLLFGKDISSNRFKVVTENGNVYLMGIVTKDESVRAINKVLEISGVRRVYHIFDYIEEQKYQGNGANDEESILVSPQKRSGNYNQPKRTSNYQDYSNSDGTYAPQQRYGSYSSGQSNSSTYVPPVQQEQNGGAYIMDEPQPSSGPASLLAPADQY